MPVIENSVLLPCSPEVAFDYLSDNRSELEWNPRCQSMEKVTDGPVGVGTRMRAKWRNSPAVELEVVSFERPHSWAIHSGGPIEVNFHARLEPVSEGTLLFVSFEPIPHGWARLAFPLLLRMLRRGERANMALIRAAVEKQVRGAE